VRLAALLGGAVVLAAGTADARGEEQRSVVVYGEGPDAAELAADVASHLSAPYALHEAGTFRKALAAGHAPSLAAAAKDRAADAKLVARARVAARAAHADAAVMLSVRRSKRGKVVHVWLVDPKGDSGSEVDQDVALGAGASVDEEGDAAWNALARGLPDRVAPAPEREVQPTQSTPARDVGSTPVARAPAAPEGAPAAPPPETADTDSGAPASEGAPERREVTRANALAAVGAAMQAGSREFTYVDRLTSTLRPYNLLAAPLAAVDAELYPLARTGSPVLKNFGATFDYAMAFGLASQDSTGASVSTAWSTFDVGARERIPIGRASLVGLHGGYGETSYSFHGALNTTAQLPDVQYRFLRGGLDARVALGAFSVFAYGSYLGVLSTGALGTYFGRASVGGVEARAGTAYATAGGFEVSLELAYTRFFYTLNPQPGDPYVAGGALDQMFRGSLGVAYLF
jgi:hypothetical protein